MYVYLYTVAVVLRYPDVNDYVLDVWALVHLREYRYRKSQYGDRTEGAGRQQDQRTHFQLLDRT
jgi:hypothetical protein